MQNAVNMKLRASIFDTNIAVNRTTLQPEISIITYEQRGRCRHQSVSPTRLAQLVLRTQVRRKETHPHHPSAPLPPLRVANPYKTGCTHETYHSANVGIGRGALQDARITRLVAN